MQWIVVAMQKLYGCHSDLQVSHRMFCLLGNYLCYNCWLPNHLLFPPVHEIKILKLADHLKRTPATHTSTLAYIHFLTSSIYWSWGGHLSYAWCLPECAQFLCIHIHLQCVLVHNISVGDSCLMLLPCAYIKLQLSELIYCTYEVKRRGGII